MPTLFLGGSRAISKSNSPITSHLATLSSAHYLVGDANGADKLFQKLLFDAGEAKVTIYHTGPECRNNLGVWKQVSVTPPSKTKDYRYFTAKDIAMAKACDRAFMLWDGESFGTLTNAMELVEQGKSCDIFISVAHKIESVADKGSLRRLIDTYATLSPEDRADKRFKDLMARVSTPNTLFPS